jgi:DNA repair protein SbcD/Mre11
MKATQTTLFLDSAAASVKDHLLMDPIRFLHLADTHIGVENYGRLDAATGLHTRLQDFATCLAFAVDTAIDREVDAVLFAGDAYKTASPSPTHEALFAGQMRRLRDQNIPVIMVTGNHDIPAAFGKASALNIFTTLGGEAHFWVRERPDVVTISTKRGAFQVACFPWPTRHLLLTRDEYKDLSDEQITRTIEEKTHRRLEKFARDLDPALPSVLLAHLATDAEYSGSERTTMIGSDPVILRSVLKNPAFDYVALGHIHKHQNLNPRHQPPVVYPGSLDRVDFGEAGEPKGFCLVALRKGEAQYEFMPAPARNFVRFDVDARGQLDPTAAILRQLAGVDVVAAVVRVFYTVDDEQRGHIDEGLIRDALRDAFLVAGITAVTDTIRRQRPRIASGLSVLETLDQYFEYTPELHPLKDDLRTYAARLLRELEERER